MDVLGLEGQRSSRSFGYVDALIKPHYKANAEKYSYVTDELLQKAASISQCSLYALDDNCALKVIGSSIEVVGGGEWNLFTATPNSD